MEKLTIEDVIPSCFQEKGIIAKNEDDLRYLGSQNLAWLNHRYEERAKLVKKQIRYAEVMYDAMTAAEKTLKDEGAIPSKSYHEPARRLILKLFESKLLNGAAVSDYREAAALCSELAKRSDKKPPFFVKPTYKVDDHVVAYVTDEAIGFFEGKVIEIGPAPFSHLYREDDVEIPEASGAITSEPPQYATVNLTDYALKIELPEGIAYKNGIPGRRSYRFDDIRLMRYTDFLYFKRDPKYFKLFLMARRHGDTRSADQSETDLIESMVRDIRYKPKS